VIEAVRDGHFHVWAIDTIDEGIELLIGRPAGKIGQEGSFHYQVDQRLRQFLDRLEKQSALLNAPRIRIPSSAQRTPAHPPLPGESA
jgi:hypothetical protein